MKYKHIHDYIFREENFFIWTFSNIMLDAKCIKNNKNPQFSFNFLFAYIKLPYRKCMRENGVFDLVMIDMVMYIVYIF